jgi:molybdopterin-guanine dinucleotide biosynthesis protein A
MNQCAAIIAGGASRRMGTPKALLPFEGAPLITRIAATLREVFPEIIVVTSEARFAEAANASMVEDVFPHRGVLGGLHAALHYFKEPTFCVACDLPYLRADVLQFFASRHRGADAWVPRINGCAEPLHALYAPALLPHFERVLQNERPPSVETVLSACSVRWLDAELRAFDEDLKFLTNWNAPDDLPSTVEIDRTTLE